MGTIKSTILTRALDDADVEVRAEDGRTRFTFSASSERTISRFFGGEILSHDKSAVRMDRLKSGAVPLLFNHDPRNPIGIVERGELKDKRLEVHGVMFDTDEAKKVAKMIEGGLRNVSIGYRLHTVEEDVKKGVYTATDWEPYEASIVSIPADYSVGIGRSSEEYEVRMFTSADTAATKEKQMTTETSAPAGETAVEKRTNVEFQTVDYGAQEQARIAQLTQLGDQCKIDGRTIQSWIDDGTDVNTASRAAVNIMAERQKHQQKQAAAYLGMSQADVGKYSLTRAIKACVEKSWPKVAPYEAEISQHVSRKLGKSEAGEYTFFVPLDVQWAAAAARAQRDLVVGTASAGGYLVGTSVQSFIDVLRNRSVAMRLGATTMPGLVGSVSIPKQLTAATGHWFASEAGTATESNLTFGQVTLTPKTVGGYVEISRQLLLQSTPNAEGIVNADLARVVGLAVDLAVLVGPGTAGQPTGIASTTGVGTANPATGTNIGYADMIRFQTTVAASNAMMPGFGYVTTPTIAGILMGKPRFTNSDTPIWGGNILDGSLVGAPALSSLQVSSATMFGGDFSQVVIGEWGVLEIEANPYAQFQAGIVGVRALYTVDIAIRYGAAFAIGTGMTA